MKNLLFILVFIFASISSSNKINATNTLDVSKTSIIDTQILNFEDNLNKDLRKLHIDVWKDDEGRIHIQICWD